MKLLPKNPRVNTSEPLGHGFDAAIVVALFFGLGWLIDHLLGTTPLFMIVMTIFGAIGVFVRFWYRYDERMTQHEADRAEKSAAQAAARRKVA
jgi:F0F1-type ATP synthase assembly protein I